MITSQQPSSAALPAKQRPTTMPTSGTSADRPREVVEGRDVQARHHRASRCRPAARRRPRRTARPAGATARRAGTGGRSSCGSARPACRRARCSRRPAPAQRARVGAEQCSPLTVPMPATMPSAGVSRIRSSMLRRLRCAAIASAPYSTKLPGSTRAATFSRAVRWPVRRRRATASGPRSSRPSAWRAIDLGEIGADVIEVDGARRGVGGASTCAGSIASSAAPS